MAADWADEGWVDVGSANETRELEREGGDLAALNL